MPANMPVGMMRKAPNICFQEYTPGDRGAGTGESRKRVLLRSLKKHKDKGGEMDLESN